MSEYTTRSKNISQKHLFESGFYDLYEDGFTNLTAGAPGPDLLHDCCEIMDIATKHRMNNEKNDQSMLFQYGPVLGRIDYRTAVAKFLTENYQDEVDKDDLILTTGATQGLHLILSTLVNLDGGIIFVDEVTYMIALKVMAQFPSLKIVTVPLTSTGVDVNALRQLINKYKPANYVNKNGKLFWGIYYTITVYHNPTGVTFSTEICKNIINLSREFDLLVVSEDVYNILTYNDSMPPKRLIAMDKMTDSNYKGNVISNGTFSKILSPGLRVGWMECPPRVSRIFQTCGLFLSGGGTNNYASGIVTSLIELGLLEKNMKKNVQIYKERMITACDILRKQLPNNCKFHSPSGGYFIWVEFPEYIDVNELNKYCSDNYKVSAIAGNQFSNENRFKNCMRISIAFHSVAKITKALNTLCNAYKEFEAKKLKQ